MTVTYNPGEPLFDQTIFDIVEVDGDVVEPQDDLTAIANATWYRVLTQRGDCPRDRDAGIDRGMELFNPELPISEGVGAIRAEIVDTPGISSVQTVTVVDQVDASRILYVSYTADTVLGEPIQNTALLQG